MCYSVIYTYVISVVYTVIYTVTYEKDSKLVVFRNCHAPESHGRLGKTQLLDLTFKVSESLPTNLYV